MNYLQDRKSKRKKYLKIGVFIFAFLFLIYFSSPILKVFSRGAHAVFRPVLYVGNGAFSKLGSLGAYFKSKSALEKENERLNTELEAQAMERENYRTILAENENLKETLGRKSKSANLLLSAILSEPNHSPYDTLIIDRGSEHGVSVNDKVYAYGNIPVGAVAEVYGATSKVTLYSSSGAVTPAVISISQAETGVSKNIFVDAVGRGGGSFEITVPRDLSIPKGTEVTLPGMTPRVLGIIEGTISEPRDAIQKILLRSPVNIFELKFVQVEI